MQLMNKNARQGTINHRLEDVVADKASELYLTIC